MIPKNHIHKFKRQIYKNTGSRFFFCTNDCDYKVACELSLGKTSICWRCDKPFQMNQVSMRLAKPHCPDCHRRKGDKVNAVQQAPKISELLSEANESSIESLRERLAVTVGSVKSDEDPML